MSTLRPFGRTPFDILVRNFLNQEANYRPVEQNIKLSHPLDIYQDNSGLTFEIACTGIPKEQLEIEIEANTLKVIYDKPTLTSHQEEDEEGTGLEYLYRGIAKRSFSLGWKIDSKFNLTKAAASFDNGLLTIKVPLAKGAKPTTLKIK